VALVSFFLLMLSLLASGLLLAVWHCISFAFNVVVSRSCRHAPAAACLEVPGGRPCIVGEHSTLFLIAHC
jgi:hypothetical protein